MSSQYRSGSRDANSAFAKAAYSRSARKKLVDSMAKMDGVRAAIRGAVATGKLEYTDTLECAQVAAEERLAAVKSRLESLRKSGEDGWEERRDALDNAWEDLSHSIGLLVARIKDQSS